MRLIDPDVQAYVDSAVPFCVKPLRGGRERPIRVARTLLTCSLAAAVLNEMGAMPETESAYVFVNVHNPARTLHCTGVMHRWACRPDRASHPAWGINWAGAALICRFLGARLPRADEWVAFASNNDPRRVYPWGNDPPSDALANFGEHVGSTTPVGHFPASDLGLCDLAGNLDEWCGDTDTRNPFERVVKGGAWSKDAHHLAIASHRSKWARLGTTTIGLRPVWDD
ncbi:SUMF1/EgtB/PvdO family nonheme iron enzyme [Rhizobacter sp. Root1221]|uniref:formylglycine-generating enzyme family protein n=1 Tax=Rhizobacter sp. Root1221 TaxID=1736433 RepID=UPI0006FCAA2A|nr:SUMF1/EgtB/PvdO family nonheme iron enzyme [Rhizobacter sp. Root1221]KQV81253.1 hypothetical protein ASC87_10015 [Rhizobacter sp. Root1221]